MGKTIKNAILLPTIFVKLLLDLNRQKKFMKLNITPIIQKSQNNNDGTLTEKDIVKINKYYALAVPAILGEAFCVLRGSIMTDAERWTSTCQGAITGLFDDFFDDLKLPEEQIVTMVNNPKHIVPFSSNVKLFLDFYKLVLSNSKFPNDIKKQLLLVHKAQVASVEQENTNITKDRIWEITQLKGGDSVLFYRTGFNNPLVEGEKEALFQLGSLMQFENDIFDIYKDKKTGIQTLPTTISKAAYLRKLYEEELANFITMCHKIDYPRNQISGFLDRVMPVLNRGFVCLDRFQNLENNNNGNFDINTFTRKQLICDMEKPGNFLKTIYYQIKVHY
ncbi:MAG: hypothetical protein QM503_03990 [Bacteroidota bacterium]